MLLLGSTHTSLLDKPVHLIMIGMEVVLGTELSFLPLQ